MTTDLLIEQIHAWRDEFAKRFNYDVGAMGDWLRQQQAKSGRPTANFPPKPAQPRPATTHQAKPNGNEAVRELFRKTQALPQVQELTDEEIAAEIEANRAGR